MSIPAGLNIIGEFIVDQLVKTLDEQGHRASGELQETMRHEVKRTGSGFDIIIYAKDYAKFVEKGLPPGVWVSADKLAKWVQDKGIATGEIQIKNLAYAIQRTIYEKGTVQFREKKKGFIEVMLDANAKIIFEKVTQLFTDQITLSLENTIRENKQIFES